MPGWKRHLYTLCIPDQLHSALRTLSTPDQQILSGMLPLIRRQPPAEYRCLQRRKEVCTEYLSTSQLPELSL